MKSNRESERGAITYVNSGFQGYCSPRKGDTRGQSSLRNMVGKERNDGGFCEMMFPRPQIALGFRLCEAVARSLFPQRLCAEIANELQHNSNLSLMHPRNYLTNTV